MVAAPIEVMRAAKLNCRAQPPIGAAPALVMRSVAAKLFRDSLATTNCVVALGDSGDGQDVGSATPSNT
jgi:hypothetical protein